MKENFPSKQNFMFNVSLHAVKPPYIVRFLALIVLNIYHLKLITVYMKYAINVCYNTNLSEIYGILFSIEGVKDGNVFCQGEEVRVVGPSSMRGHLKVERREVCLDVPYNLLDLKV